MSKTTRPSPPPEEKPLDIEDLFNGAQLKTPIILFVVIIALVTFGKSFYTVPAESEAVVLRFGRFHDKQDAGLRFKVPFIDDVTILPHQAPAQAGVRLWLDGGPLRLRAPWL